MFKLKDKLKFININQDYLKYLHECCSEVYYKQFNYVNKPYLGILINEDKNQYVIPLSSAKEKHKNWKNIDTDRFLRYENCPKSTISKKAVYKENKDGTVTISMTAGVGKDLKVAEGSAVAGALITLGWDTQNGPYGTAQNKKDEKLNQSIQIYNWTRSYEALESCME